MEGRLLLQLSKEGNVLSLATLADRLGDTAARLGLRWARRAHDFFIRFARMMRRRRASFFHRTYRLQHLLRVKASRFSLPATLLGLGGLVAASFLALPGLDRYLANSSPISAVEGTRDLLLAIGGALMGATAIVTSLVLFSLQINVERLPHGLFMRLSSDRRLLSAFAGAFLLAILITALSQVRERALLGTAVLISAWSTVVTLLLFLYSYRRALALINPIQQLRLMMEQTRRELRAWAKRSDRARPLLEDEVSPSPSPGSDHDIPKATYFQVNSHWTDGAKQAVRYAIAFARRFSEQGDHEVSGAALNTVVGISAAYVRAKGHTFFANVLFLDNPLATDGFINDTLEHLRQTVRIATARGDEQLIEQAFGAFFGLVTVYSTINYGSTDGSKTHAHLAAGYLAGEVERTVAHKMPDVVMEGVRLMGQCAHLLLAAEGPNGIRALVQRLGVVGACGIASEEYRPVTSASVEQLALLSFGLLRIKDHEVKYVAEEIRRSLALLAKLMYSAVPDAPLSRTHSTLLGPYYSATSTSGLRSRMTALANAVVSAKADDEAAAHVISNFESWADGMYGVEKELLLQAIKCRSHLTFDLLHWIKEVTGILLALSTSEACDEHVRSELRSHALWLVSVYSFVPDDKESIEFVETFGLTELLFEAALEARRRGVDDVAEDILTLLVGWMFRGGKYESGWGILQRSIYGAAGLALCDDTDASIGKLLREIRNRLQAGGLSDGDVRKSAAQEIRDRASAFETGHWSSSIEQVLGRREPQRRRRLLLEIADVLDPE